MDDILFAIQTDTALEFENYWDSNLSEAEFVTADEIEELEENNEDEKEDSCILKEGEIINNDYKRRAVEFWKSGKKGRYTLSTIQHRFRKHSNYDGRRHSEQVKQQTTQISSNPNSKIDVDRVVSRKDKKKEFFKQKCSKFGGKNKHSGKKTNSQQSGKKCGRCDGDTHPFNQCPAAKATCHKCKRKGHYAKVCKNTTENKVQNVTESSDIFIGTATTTEKIPYTKKKKWTIKVEVTNCSINFKVDTGAEITCISSDTYYTFFDDKCLQPSDKRIYNANQKLMNSLEFFSEKVRYRNKSKIVDIYVIEGLGVIEPIEEPTEWCSGLVLSPKPNGIIRMCVDYIRLNKYVLREIHPIPNTENVLGQIGEAKYFSKMDANHGFWQCELDQESQLLTTFITPFGRYKYKRLPFGINAAPEFFQKRMQQILQGLAF
ncbi:hypothetical protein RF55_9507 [Lasius niger]|uniref:Reverse transcriptase domain-containing protein n=1 Tax=Lasius niger TaxID=67767 RepID=A0A0J7KKG0_LASNI|nr:hypothetical protein RF55_9507 [Lasius niger]